MSSMKATLIFLTIMLISCSFSLKMESESNSNKLIQNSASKKHVPKVRNNTWSNTTLISIESLDHNMIPDLDFTQHTIARKQNNSTYSNQKRPLVNRTQKNQIKKLKNKTNFVYQNRTLHANGKRNSTRLALKNIAQLAHKKKAQHANEYSPRNRTKYSNEYPSRNRTKYSNEYSPRNRTEHVNEYHSRNMTKYSNKLKNQKSTKSN